MPQPLELREESLRITHAYMCPYWVMTDQIWVHTIQLLFKCRHLRLHSLSWSAGVATYWALEGFASPHTQISL